MKEIMVMGFTLMGFMWRVTGTAFVLMVITTLLASLADGKWAMFIAGVFILLFLLSVAASLICTIWLGAWW